VSWKSEPFSGGFLHKFELPQFLAWKFSGRSLQKRVSGILNYLLTNFPWTVNNAQNLLERLFFPFQHCFLVQWRWRPRLWKQTPSYWRRRTHRVDRPVSKHLRTQRRLNSYIFFLCFWSSKNICNPPPSPFKAAKIAQFNKGMQKLWCVWCKGLRVWW
jgi:hypothetical protein